jgi:hypothetical protein
VTAETLPTSRISGKISAPRGESVTFKYQPLRLVPKYGFLSADSAATILEEQPPLAGTVARIQSAMAQFKGVLWGDKVREFMSIQFALDTFLAETIRALLEYFPEKAIEVQRNTDPGEPYQLCIFVGLAGDFRQSIDELEKFEFGWWFAQNQALRARVLLLPK